MVRKFNSITSLLVALIVLLNILYVPVETVEAASNIPVVNSETVDANDMENKNKYYMLRTASHSTWKNTAGVWQSTGQPGQNKTSEMKIDLPEGAEVTRVIRYDKVDDFNTTFIFPTGDNISRFDSYFTQQDDYNNVYLEHISNPYTIDESKIKVDGNVLTIPMAYKLTEGQGVDIKALLGELFNLEGITEPDQDDMDRINDLTILCSYVMSDEIFNEHKLAFEQNKPVEGYTWFQPVVVEYILKEKIEQVPIIKYYYDSEDGSLSTNDEASFIKSQYPMGNEVIIQKKEEGYTFAGWALLDIGELGLFVNHIPTEDRLHFGDTASSMEWDDSKPVALLGELLQGNDMNDLPQIWELVQRLSLYGAGMEIMLQDNNLLREELIDRSNINHITFDFKSSGNDYQLIALYSKDGVPITGYRDPLNFAEGSTTVSIWLHDEDGTFRNRVDAVVSKNSEYELQEMPGYKLEEWVLIEDNIEDVPDITSSWNDILSNTEESGTGSKVFDGSDWNYPDKELHVKYVKELRTIDHGEGEIVLTEKRISWLRDLDDIGGRPEIQFSWRGLDYHEHYDDEGGMWIDNEYISYGDEQFSLVVTNVRDVQYKVLGTATGFVPKEISHVLKVYSHSAPGLYSVIPNYEYVIWRHLDIPTIAQYKYSGGTVIENLIGGPNFISKQPYVARHSENSNSYQEKFTMEMARSIFDSYSKWSFLNRWDGDPADAESAYLSALHSIRDLEKQETKTYQNISSARKSLSSTEKAYSKFMSKGGYRIDWLNHPENRRYNPDVYRSYNYYLDQITYWENELVRLDQVLESIRQQRVNARAIVGLDLSSSVTGNIGKYEQITLWPCWSGESSREVDPSNSVVYDITVDVQVEYGTENRGVDKVTFASTNLRSFGIDYSNVKANIIDNDVELRFYPYVEMLYDTTTGLTDQKVNVLAGHMSTLIPQDYVEIGYRTKAIDSLNGTGLLLESTQWSTHAQAGVLSGKLFGSTRPNTVLPGGAIFTLRTPSGSQVAGAERTKVGITSWLNFVPSDTNPAMLAGQDYYSEANQTNRNNEMIKKITQSLNSLDIVQKVASSDSAETGGTKVDYTQRGSQVVANTSGQPTSPDMKYWLVQEYVDGDTSDPAKMLRNDVNRADIDIINTQSNKVYYRVMSDVEGNVYVTKSSTADGTRNIGSAIGTINKTQGLAELLAQNTEIAALNNRTNIVGNYLLSVDRNLGYDPSLPAGQEKWYNEAFDGFCVVRIDTQIEIGISDPNNVGNGIRTTALDPKLLKPRSGQSNILGSGTKSWFETDDSANTYNGTPNKLGEFITNGRRVDILMNNMSGLYRTKTFIIPNVSVMDLF